MHGDMGREVRTTTPAQERRHGRLREKAAFGIPPTPTTLLVGLSVSCGCSSPRAHCVASDTNWTENGCGQLMMTKWGGHRRNPKEAERPCYAVGSESSALDSLAGAAQKHKGPWLCIALLMSVQSTGGPVFVPAHSLPEPSTISQKPDWRATCRSSVISIAGAHCEAVLRPMVALLAARLPHTYACTVPATTRLHLLPPLRVLLFFPFLLFS